MATRLTQSIAAPGGTAATYYAASGGGDKITPGRDVYLHVKNGDSNPVNVTLVTPGTVDGNAIADRVIAVPATSEKFIPVPADVYEGADGLASITWSATTSLTFAAIRA